MSAHYHHSIAIANAIPRTISFDPDHTLPLSILDRSDGETTIAFLSGNGIYFIQASEDEWYRAQSPGGPIVSSTDSNMPFRSSSWRPTEAASPLGCVEQWQWCNSVHAGKHQCGPLSTLHEAVLGAATLFKITVEDLKASNPVSENASGTRLTWSLKNFFDNPTRILELVEHLGATALSSKTLVYGGVQWGIADDQWKKDVTHWFNIILATMQAAFVDTALGPKDGPRLPPANKAEQDICNNQVCKLYKTPY